MKQLKDGDIDEITAKIYSRPRKKLNFSDISFKFIIEVYTFFRLQRYDFLEYLSS